MASWNELLEEIKFKGSTYDVVRREHLKRLNAITGRNIIIYYSGWLQKPGLPGVQVNDADKNGFMAVIHNLDRSKGLDLVLHTPGGEIAATESLVDYLRAMFGNDIRAVIPQLAMSAGTMIACSCKEIIMGKQSSLGPIDPQYANLPAHGIIEEFNRAALEISQDPMKVAVWQPILSRYSPTLIGECEKAVKWSNEMVREWLMNGMLALDPEKVRKVNEILTEIADHSLNLSHNRHLSAEKCRAIGLKVLKLEDDDALQDAVLSVHHACIHTLSGTSAYKIIENQNGVAFLQLMQDHVILKGHPSAVVGEGMLEN